jgi:predicted Zn-dependent peptidase
MFTRRLTLFCSLLLAFSLVAGCGGKQTEADESSGESAASTDTTEATDDAPARLTDGVEELNVNGIRVIVKHKPDAQLLTAGVYFDGGAPYWNPDLAGAERLALSVATKAGPEGMSKSEFQATLDRVGATVSASSGPDYAQARLSTLASTLDGTWDLFTSTILNPGFPSDEVELAREKQLTTIRTRMDSPDSAVVEVAQATAFAGHPYEIREEGEESTVTNLTTDNLKEALERLRVRERMVVVFVGDITAERANTLVTEGFSDVPSNPDWEAEMAYAENPELNFDSPELNINARPELPTNYIIGYYTVPGHTDEDYPAMLIGSKLLRENLFEEVRTKRNLTYAVSAGIGSRRDNIGYLYVTATDPETTLNVMYDTVDSLIETPPSEDELRNQVLVYLTDYYMDLQSPGAQASTLAEWELLGGGWEHADKLNDELRALEPSDISAALQEHIRNLKYGVVGNPDRIPSELFESR